MSTSEQPFDSPEGDEAAETGFGDSEGGETEETDGDTEADRGPEADTDTGTDTASRELDRGEWWAAVFWLFLGLCTTVVVLVFSGLDLELVLPGVVLVLYGLFVLWNPELATTDAPWTGLVWLALGVVTLVLLQVFALSWAYHLSGIIIGFFLVFAGVLVLLDL